REARRRTSMTRHSSGRFGRAAKWISAATLAATVAAPVALRARHDQADRDRPDPDRVGMDDRDRDGDDDDTGTPIRHLVVIFQENVSFDHYFATYPRAANSDGPTFTAKAGTPLVNGLFPGGLLDHNPNTVTVNGVSNPAQPFRLSHAQAVTCDQDHDYGDEQKTFNAGPVEWVPGHGRRWPLRAAGLRSRQGAGHGLLRRQHRDGVLELRAEFRDERQFLQHDVRSVDARGVESDRRTDARREARAGSGRAPRQP